MPFHRDWKREIERICPGRTQYGVPLRSLCTFRVGGPAEVLVKPANAGEVSAVVRFARESGIPLTVIGRGSNILPPDEGVSGILMRIGPPTDALRAEERGRDFLVHAPAGLPLRALLRACVRNGWEGAEFSAGIPGFLGGSIAMNAGTPSGCIGDLVESVTWVDENGDFVETDKDRLRFEYRRLHLPERCVIVGAVLRVKKGSRDKVTEAVREKMRDRLKKQPLEFPSAGSVFKNPPGDSAGRIIDAAGLKGRRVGGAGVSEKHANFIVNYGDATSGEIEELIRIVREKVFDETGIRLELEIKTLGRRIT